MKIIKPPPMNAGPDRFLQCQEAMDDAFTRLAEAAELAGWHPEEVAAALLELADNKMLAIIANHELASNLGVFGSTS